MSGKNKSCGKAEQNIQGYKFSQSAIKSFQRGMSHSEEFCRCAAGFRTNGGGKAWKPPRNDLGRAHNSDGEFGIHGKLERLQRRNKCRNPLVKK